MRGSSSISLTEMKDSFDNLISSSEFSALPKEERSECMNALLSSLSEKDRNTIHFQVWQRSNRPRGENWGARHVADDSSILKMAYQHAMSSAVCSSSFQSAPLSTILRRVSASSEFAALSISQQRVLEHAMGIATPASVFSGKYDLKQIGPQQAAQRIKILAEQLKREIKDADPTFQCPVTLAPAYDPVVTSCGHTFNRVMENGRLVIESGKSCHVCRAAVTLVVPNIEFKRVIDKWQKKDPIPTLAAFKEVDEELASVNFAAASLAVSKGKYETAIKLYQIGFKYTRSSEHYAQVPALYERIGDRTKAALAYLHLAKYQSEEGKVSEAIVTLEKCRETGVDLEIDSLLIGLKLSLDSSESQIRYAMSVAISKRNPEMKVEIYQQIIAYAPQYLEAYAQLLPLMETSHEKRGLFWKAAEVAELAGNAELTARYRQGAEEVPTAIIPEDWQQPASLMAKLPPFPIEMQSWLEAPNPLYPGKTNAQTHIVAPSFKNIITVVEGKIVLKPTTLDNINQLDKSTKGIGFEYIWEDLLTPEVDIPPEVELEYLVLTREVLPGSLVKSYEEQKKQVEASGYEIPGLREAAYCLLWENRNSKTCLYRETLTCCRQEFDKQPAILGLFNLYGPTATLHQENLNCIGIAGLRRFSVR